MQNNLIDIFTSKEFRFLQWLANQSCVEIDGKKVIRMSQPQLAKAYGVSATTVFHLLETLKIANCIELNNKKSGYIITQTGHTVISKVKELEKIIGGNRNGD